MTDLFTPMDLRGLNTPVALTAMIRCQASVL
jgi:hypothetical protein